MIILIIVLVKHGEYLDLHFKVDFETESLAGSQLNINKKYFLHSLINKSNYQLCFSNGLIPARLCSMLEIRPDSVYQPTLELGAPQREEKDYIFAAFVPINP